MAVSITWAIVRGPCATSAAGCCAHSMAPENANTNAMGEMARESGDERLSMNVNRTLTTKGKNSAADWDHIIEIRY